MNENFETTNTNLKEITEQKENNSKKIPESSGMKICTLIGYIYIEQEITIKQFVFCTIILDVVNGWNSNYFLSI